MKRKPPPKKAPKKYSHFSVDTAKTDELAPGGPAVYPSDEPQHTIDEGALKNSSTAKVRQKWKDDLA